MQKTTIRSLLAIGLLLAISHMFVQQVLGMFGIYFDTVYAYLVAHLLIAAVLGISIAYFFRGKISSGYSVVVYASLLLYASTNLLSFAMAASYLAYVCALVLAAVALCIASYRYFANPRLSMKNKQIIAAILLMAWFFISSASGLYLGRLLH